MSSKSECTTDWFPDTSEMLVRQARRGPRHRARQGVGFALIGLASGGSLLWSGSPGMALGRGEEAVNLNSMCKLYQRQMELV
jgi:hypothetical protein